MYWYFYIIDLVKFTENRYMVWLWNKKWTKKDNAKSPTKQLNIITSETGAWLFYYGYVNMYVKAFKFFTK